MPKDDINYRFTENGIVYDFYDVFVPAENFRQPALWTWGLAATGRLGTNDTAPTRLTPVTTFAGGTTWKQVFMTNPSGRAIKTDGSLWSWGNGTFGQFGNFSTATISTPVTTFAGGNNWKSVYGGYLHVVALKTDGTLWTWGDNSGGQLGTNDSTTRSTPVTTFAGGNDWKSISTGYGAAIKTDGSLWIWGGNNPPRLGTNDITLRRTPVTTFAGGNNWKSVSGGYQHTAAIKTDGSLWTWGLGTSGQLGDNTIITRSTPVTTFAGGNDWKSVSCGYNHTTAIKTDGSLWIWGNGGDGRLGNFATTNRSTPVTTFAGGNNWKQVSAGKSSTGAIKTDGSLWIWGTNGRLGTNDNIVRSTPVTTFAGGNNWKQVAVADTPAAAIKYSPDP